MIGVDRKGESEKTMNTMNTIWTLICACFVFFMQAGFTCYEAGMVQSKNVISVAIENMFNLIITIVFYSLIGFPIMYGSSLNDVHDYSFFFMQVMFAATSVTIFAGALSERTKLAPLLIAGAVSAAVIYPVFGRLVWGGRLSGEPSWLEKLGYMDFAGASVVHMTAGFIALAGLLVVGSRTKKNTGKSNIPLAVLGVFILWFGWFGFNGGCIAPDSPELGKIFLNTSLAAACGTLGTLSVNLLLKRRGGYLLSVFNGVLSGLTSITAVSAYCSPVWAMVLGFVSGVIADLVTKLLLRLKIDDVVNVVATHLAGGITGCLLLPFMIDESYLQAGSRLAQLGAQAAGLLVCCFWTFGFSYILFRLLKRFTGLRVTAEEEAKGLNIVEFSDIYSWQSYIETSSYEREIRDKNDLLRKQARLLAMTEEQEKKKLARDLHDGVGQSLSALKLILGMGKTRAEKTGDGILAKNAEKAAELADLSLKEMRNVLNNLQPEVLRKEGLLSGLRSMTETLNNLEGFTCGLQVEDELPSFDDTVQLNIYRLIQEALTNVVKHADATSAAVICRWSSAPDRYLFIVKDDGKGFDPDTDHMGVGMSSMEDRLQMLGGSFALHTAEGRGTEIVMEVPVYE